MFQRKIDVIFTEVLSVFGIAYDIVVIGYDKYSTDYDTVLHRVLQICKKES